MLEQNNQEYILYLCTMMKTPLCIISYTDISISKNFRQYSELNFEVPYYDNGWIQVENKTFNLFQPNYIILLETRNNNEIIDTEYFIINQPSTKYDDGEAKKNIQCYSAESIFNNRFLTAYEDIRVLYDPDNSYNLSDNTKGGILNYMLENMHGIWSVDYISSSLLGVYHSFKYSSQSYRSVIEDLESVYNCIFKFDTVNNKISIYTADEIGEDTEIILSDENFIKSLTCDIKNAEACTMLRVYGKDNITISDQNPTGMPWLYDFSYLLNNGYLSSSLSSALTTYNNLITSKEGEFTGYLSSLSTLRATLLIRQNELADLNTTMKTIDDSLDLLISNNRRNTSSYDTIYSNKLVVKSQIVTKEGQISTVEGQINTVLNDIRSLNTLLSLENNFTSEQLIELSYYISEGPPLKLDSVDNSALLYKYAKQYMKIKSTPPFDFTIDLVDLFSISNDYIEDRYSKIKVGNFIYIDCPKLGFNCDRYRITQISHNKLNNSLSITISNKDKINTALYYLDKILKEIPKEVDSLKINKEDYSKYVEESNRILYDNSLIDLEYNEIKISNENFINRRGFLGNSLGTRNGAIKIQGDQIVFSPDGDFQTFYSILNPDGLYLETEDKSSRTVISSSTGLQVDVWNSLTNDFRNAIYIGLQSGVPSLFIDNGFISLTRIVSAVETNKIYIDPSVGIVMQKTNGLGGWINTMYLDVAGNLNFTGIITGGLFRTAASPEKRIEIENNQIRTYSSGTTLQGFCTNSDNDRFGDIDFYAGGLKVFSIYNTLDAGVALIQQNSKSLYVGVQDENTYMRGDMYFTNNCTGVIQNLTQADAAQKTDWLLNQIVVVDKELKMWNGTELIPIGANYAEGLRFSTGTQLISLGKQYTMSLPCHPTIYNDINYELTNGIKASTDFHDSQYVGWEDWEDVDVLDIDFDFKILRMIQKVIVSGLSSTNGGIYIPQSIEVLTSTDGVSYVSQDIQYPVLNTGIYKYSIELDFEVECRYVRVRIRRQPGMQFVFLDEIEIYAAAIGAVMGGSMLPTPSENFRGKFFTLFDSVNGDTTYICNRASTGEYIWKSIT